MPALGQRASLAVRNSVFTLIVPGAGGAYVPWLLINQHGRLPAPGAWYALPVIAAGVAGYLSCQWMFAARGRGTPGLWDAPRRLVVAGPYRWVRNPIYLSALLVVGGEAWLWLSPILLLYACGLAVAFHLFVSGYEEPRLRTKFGADYLAYCREVPRWLPRRPTNATSPP